MKKYYTIILTGRVKELSFMRFTEDLVKRLLVRAIIHDVSYYERKIMCEAEEDTVNEFCRLAKESKLVTETKIEEGIKLPYPPVFAVPI